MSVNGTRGPQNTLTRANRRESDSAAEAARDAREAHRGGARVIFLGRDSPMQRVRVSIIRWRSGKRVHRHHTRAVLSGARAEEESLAANPRRGLQLPLIN